MNVLRVALDVPLATLFDYLQPSDAQQTPARPGDRVVVPFGRRERVGIVMECVAASPIPHERLKPIVRTLEDAPRLPPDWLELMRFLSSYYQRPLGETVAGSLPPRLRSVKALPKRRPSPSPAEGGPDEPRFISGNEPNPAQADAIERIGAALGNFKPFLLHGVTGSGKTEVYLAAIAECLARDRQALVLVPEIALTEQLVARFRRRFGTAVGVLHSALGERERMLTWSACASGQVRILIGTRSAVWARLPQLGLLVVDEEHDPSYKQQDGFRYSARDIALVRAQNSNVPVVLGSATPSLETLANVERGKYLLTTLRSRAGSAPMPVIECMDVRGLDLTAGMGPHLIAAIRHCLTRGEQVMLFLNRRGYSPLLICRHCGEPKRCDRCDAFLVYHKGADAARCHHCDRQWSRQAGTPCCEAPEIALMGLGTERIEEAVAELFPEARICRIDRDTARRKDALREMLDAINAREVDIVIGTQMLAKGLDFSAVTLVGVVDADSRLYSLDFRAEERLAQLIIQVAGRAGRASLPGRVLVQTHQPHHPVLRQIIDEGYESYAATALEQRREAALPPYGAMAILRAESAQPAAALKFLGEARRLLLAEAPAELDLSYPLPAMMERRAGRYRALMVMRAAQRFDIGRLLRAALPALDEMAAKARVRPAIDVDPQDTL